MKFKLTNVGNVFGVDPELSTNDILVNSRGMIKLYFDRTSGRKITEKDYTVRIGTVKSYTNGFKTIHQYQNLNMSLSLKPSGSNIKDKEVYTLEGAEKIEISDIKVFDKDMNEIIDTNNVAEGIKIELYVEYEKYIELKYNAPPAITNCKYDASTNYLDVVWSYVPGASEYELEWSYIDGYNYDASTQKWRCFTEKGLKDSTDKKINFKTNATRIISSDQHYNIPMVYGCGMVVYRVRGVGEYKKDVKDNYIADKTYTKWSLSQSHDNDDIELKNLTLLTNYYYISKSGGFEKEKQWAYSLLPTEEGKRSEIIGYFDGSGKVRQTVSKQGEKLQPLVDETIYDAQGRPAVSVLPHPSYSTNLHYKSGTNRPASDTNRVYGSLDFEKNGTECFAGIDSMQKSFGSSNYYSEKDSAGFTAMGYQSYLPNAGGYPFVVREYERDERNIIKREIGPGKDFILNEKGKTYFYTGASQAQLSRMFGSQVGNASHYRMNSITDENGQMNNSYLDSKGRVIATSVTGKTANTMDVSDRPDTSMLTEYLLNVKYKSPTGSGEGELLSITGKDKDYTNGFGNRVYKEDFMVGAKMNYTFRYNKDSIMYEDNKCLNSLISCKFKPDVRITFIDNNKCGKSEIFLDTRDAVNTYPMEMNKDYTRFLDEGSYSIMREMWIRQDEIDACRNKYLTSKDTCLIMQLSSFKPNFNCDSCEVKCEECLPVANDPALQQNLVKDPVTPEDVAKGANMCKDNCEEKTECNVVFSLLQMDIMPRGQYCKLKDDGTRDENAILSVLSSSNPIWDRQTAWTGDAWRKPILVESVKDGAGYKVDTTRKGYYNDIGQRDSILAYSPNGLDIRAKFSTNKLVTVGERQYGFPEDLLSVDDFLVLYKDNADNWGRSLVRFHPEFCKYEQCVQTRMISFGFENKINNMDYETFPDTINSYMICKTGCNCSSANRNYPLLDMDPYFALPGHSVQKDTMTARLGNYNGTGKNVLELIAVLGESNDKIDWNQTDMDELQADIYNKYYQTGTENEEINSLKWQTYRGIYMAMKNKIEKENAMPQCDCNCIGNADYRAVNPVYADNIYPKNAENSKYYPCIYQTLTIYNQYGNMTRRIMDDVQKDMLEDSTKNNADLIQKMKLMRENELYSQTGQCASADDLGNIIKDQLVNIKKSYQTNSRINSQLLKNSNLRELLSTLNAEVATTSNPIHYYSWNLVEKTDTTFKVNIVSAYKDGTLSPVTSTSAYISLKIENYDGAQMYNWDSILDVRTLLFNNVTPGSNPKVYRFSMTANVVLNGPNRKNTTISGETNLNINNCMDDADYFSFIDSGGDTVRIGSSIECLNQPKVKIKNDVEQMLAELIAGKKLTNTSGVKVDFCRIKKNNLFKELQAKGATGSTDITGDTARIFWKMTKVDYPSDVPAIPTLLGILYYKKDAQTADDTLITIALRQNNQIPAACSFSFDSLKTLNYMFLLFGEDNTQGGKSNGLSTESNKFGLSVNTGIESCSYELAGEIYDLGMKECTDCKHIPLPIDIDSCKISYNNFISYLRTFNLNSNCIDTIPITYKDYCQNRYYECVEDYKYYLKNFLSGAQCLKDMLEDDKYMTLKDFCNSGTDFCCLKKYADYNKTVAQTATQIISGTADSNEIPLGDGIPVEGDPGQTLRELAAQLNSFLNKNNLIGSLKDYNEIGFCPYAENAESILLKIGEGLSCKNAGNNNCDNTPDFNTILDTTGCNLIFASTLSNAITLDEFGFIPTLKRVKSHLDSIININTGYIDTTLIINPEGLILAIINVKYPSGISEVFRIITTNIDNLNTTMIPTPGTFPLFPDDDYSQTTTTTSSDGSVTTTTTITKNLKGLESFIGMIGECPGKCNIKRSFQGADPSDTIPIEEMLCEDTLRCHQREDSIAKNLWNDYLLATKTQLGRSLNDIAGRLNEWLTLRHKDMEYRYTLMYYDLAGNKVQEVLPSGVKMSPVDPVSNLATMDSVHKLVNIYAYNSTGKVIGARLADHDTIAGSNGWSVRYWYDKAGRLILSQNAEQAKKLNFTYILYDNLSREIEKGETANGNTPADTILWTMEDLKIWIGNITPNDVIKTHYDKATSDADITKELKQENLRSRISWIENDNEAIYFSYDVHGNAKSILRKIQNSKYKIMIPSNGLITSTILFQTKH